VSLGGTRSGSPEGADPTLKSRLVPDDGPDVTTPLAVHNGHMAAELVTG
jgi:hypothetical protein